MNRLLCIENISNLFSFKTVFDDQKNEYVLFEHSCTSSACGVTDKTAFEASENHVHLLDNITRHEFYKLQPIAKKLATSLLKALKHDYPSKNFLVFASIHCGDSFIIRFHQKWPDEEPFCYPDEITSSKEKVFLVEG